MTSFRIAVAGAALVALTGSGLDAQQVEPRRIATAPAFDARQLTAHPTQDWITNGGNVFNQRYSPLTLLDRDNVKDLNARATASTRSPCRRTCPSPRQIRSTWAGASRRPRPTIAAYSRRSTSRRTS